MSGAWAGFGISAWGSHADVLAGSAASGSVPSRDLMPRLPHLAVEVCRDAAGPEGQTGAGNPARTRATRAADRTPAIESLPGEAIRHGLTRMVPLCAGAAVRDSAAAPLPNSSHFGKSALVAARRDPVWHKRSGECAPVDCHARLRPYPRALAAQSPRPAAAGAGPRPERGHGRGPGATAGVQTVAQREMLAAPLQTTPNAVVPSPKIVVPLAASGAGYAGTQTEAPETVRSAGGLLAVGPR
jgi:hypothetical protein